MHYTKADGLSSNHVSWITTHSSDVWFASKEDGVSRFDKVTGEWTIYKQADFLADNDVRAITRDTDGNLWMATVGGISMYAPQTRSWEIISKEDGLPTPYITSILINQKSRQPSVSDQGDAFVAALDTDATRANPVVWIGTSLGPAMYDPTSQKWTQLDVPDAPKNPLILSVLVRDGSVWFGGAEGVWRYSIADKQMHRATDGLPDPSVNVLFSTGEKGKEETLWAGTRRGLARYDINRQRWVPLSFNAQLPSPNVTALAFGDGTLWIGTPQGLGSYTIASDSWNSLSNVPYNIRDILCAETDKILWLATDIGLVE